jgi:hypothetical protein
MDDLMDLTKTDLKQVARSTIIKNIMVYAVSLAYSNCHEKSFHTH